MTYLPTHAMLYVMRNLLIIVGVVAAYVFVMHGLDDLVPSPTVTVATVANETTKPTETTSTHSAYAERVAQGAAEWAARPAPQVERTQARTSAPCGGDAECARVHGLPEDAPITQPRGCPSGDDTGDRRVCGNRVAGVGSVGGPVNGQCDEGGTYVARNEYGKRVCQY